MPWLPSGLRGRLLLAFVAAAALTLAVVATIVLGPLRERLRDQSVDNLQTAVLASRAEFEAAIREGDGADPSVEVEVEAIGRDLRERADARVLVGNVLLTRTIPGFDEPPETISPAFFSDTELGAPDSDATLVALRALRLRKPMTRVDGDDVTVGVPLADDGVLVAQRRLTEVATTVELVRNALLVAAGIGLAVAIVLAIMLSGTLLRRLARLRAAALRITADGPDAPAPRDEGRDEVGDLARALARMQQELRRQEAARRSFVSTASHELRTPLTMLQGTMELLEEDLHDGQLDIADAQVQVTNARRELRRLSALASELLDLSRLDAAVQLRSEPVEMSEVARAVAAEFQLPASERDVHIDIRSPTDSCWALGDPDAIARVVRILIDNALRYGPRDATVTVITTLSRTRASIEVADLGQGVLPDERERIFERFHRGRAASAESGFGLGLAIGRELAERMDGELGIRETEGSGTTFAFTLPVSSRTSAATGLPLGGWSSNTKRARRHERSVD